MLLLLLFPVIACGGILIGLDAKARIDQELRLELSRQFVFAVTAAKCDRILLESDQDLVRLHTIRPRKTAIDARVYRIRKDHSCERMDEGRLPASARAQSLFTVQKHHFVSQVYTEQDGSRWFVVGRWPDWFWNIKPNRA